MVRKSAITMTCMLLTVGCTGLQTKGVNESASGNKKRNNDNKFSTSNNVDNENITIEVVQNKKNNNEDETKYSKQETTKVEKSNKNSNAYIDESIDNLRVTKLFDENKLVDRSMPNSQLVLQKLSELKRKHQEILKSGTFSEKKTMKLQNELLKSYSNWKGTKYELGGDSEYGMDC